MQENALENATRTCDDLLRISLAQRQAIADGMLDLLGDLLNERENLIATLDLIVVGQGSSLLDRFKEVLRIDEENTRALQTQMAEVRSQLMAIGRGKNALQGYAFARLQSAYSDKRC